MFDRSRATLAITFVITLVTVLALAWWPLATAAVAALFLSFAGLWVAIRP